ncbi:MAG: hypothetical protein GX802_07025 [Clostridiales bacterium]|nr:hypothetical protein [Clostridiales bacterium]
MKLSIATKMSLSSMVVALSVVLLYAAGMIPYIRLVLLLTASVSIYALLCEEEFLFAFLAYLATGLLSALLVPDKMFAVLYVGLFGHYAIFKVFIDGKVKDKIIGHCIKLLYCNVFLALGIFLGIKLFGFTIPQIKIPQWLIIVAVEALLVAFDLLQGFAFRFYEYRIRSVLLPRR